MYYENHVSTGILLEDEVQILKEEMNKMGNIMERLAHDVAHYKNEWVLYTTQFGGRHFTEEEQKKIKEFQEQIRVLPDDADTD